MKIKLRKEEIENHALMVLDELLGDIEKDINDPAKEPTEKRSLALKIAIEISDEVVALVSIKGSKSLADTKTDIAIPVDDVEQETFSDDDYQ